MPSRSRPCFDSWAILRWLEQSETAASAVEEAFTQDPLMSWINLGEVFYIACRAEGPERAQAVVDDLRTRITLDIPIPAQVLAAARIKADYAMAYADAFAIATSEGHGATLLTGDPEILEAGGPWRVEDLRPG